MTRQEAMEMIEFLDLMAKGRNREIVMEHNEITQEEYEEWLKNKKA